MADRHDPSMEGCLDNNTRLYAVDGARRICGSLGSLPRLEKSRMAEVGDEEADGQIFRGGKAALEVE